MVRTRMKAEVICRAQRILIKALFELCGVFWHIMHVLSVFSLHPTCLFLYAKYSSPDLMRCSDLILKP